MSNADKNLDTLRDFGLSANQAKVYLTALTLGTATIGQVSKDSNVRREDVYRILPRLENMGLIDRILGTPTRIRATPLEEALSILVKLQEDTAKEKLATLKARKVTMLKDFTIDERRRGISDDKGQFTLFSQKDRIMSKGLSMIAGAQKHADIVTSEQELVELILDYPDTIRKALRKGVDIRVILEVSGQDTSILGIIKEQKLGDKQSFKGVLNLKSTQQVLSHYFVVDYNEAMVSTSKEPRLAENQYLWTVNKNLVGLMQENFEEAWNVSADLKAIQTSDVPEKLTRFVADLKPRDHVILAYQSTEAKHTVLFKYIQVGLEKGEAAVYVASEEGPGQIEEAMKRAGIDVENYEKKGALQVLGYEKIYIINGEFNKETTLGLWKHLHNEAQLKGFKGLRVCGEMACFFRHNLMKELLEYERALHQILDLPMTAICAYNTQMITKVGNPIDLYTELVRAHGFVLFSGIDNKLGKIEVRTA